MSVFSHFVVAEADKVVGGGLRCGGVTQDYNVYDFCSCVFNGVLEDVL